MKQVGVNMTCNQNDEFRLKSIYFSVVNDFEEYVRNKFSHTYSVSVINHLKKMFIEYDVKTLTEMRNLIISGKIHNKASSLAVRVLLNYCENNELMDIDEIEVYRRRIKVKSKTHIDKYIPKDEEIMNSVTNLRENLDKKYYLIYRFMIETSCRYTEAVHFFENFDKKHLEIDNGVCSYSNFYLRGKKTSFYLLFTQSLYEELKPLIGEICEKDLNYLKRKSQREDNLVCLKYLRKYSFTLYVKNKISLQIADMISGRSQKSNVGISHYLAQREIMVQEYQKVVEIMKKIK